MLDAFNSFRNLTTLHIGIIHFTFGHKQKHNLPIEIKLHHLEICNEFKPQTFLVLLG